MSKKKGVLAFAGATSRRDQFKKDVKKATTKQEERAAEMKNLKPEPLEKKTSRRSSSKKHLTGIELKVFFRSKPDFELYREFVKVVEYQGFNTYDTDLITHLFKKFVKKSKKGEILIRKVGGDGWVKLKPKKKAR